jgi:hypothetical protein
MAAPLVVLFGGIGTFVVLAGAGLSVIDRYLLMPAVMILIFCAFALSGWTMLQRGLLRRLWALGAATLAGVGIYLAASTLSLNKIETELGFRDDSHTSLVAILDKPAVAQRLACGPLSVPDHKLVPDVRIILNRGRSDVIDRSYALDLYEHHRQPRLYDEMQRGVELIPLGLAISRYALTSPNDSPLVQVPLPGFTQVAVTQYYSAYARC